MALPSHWISILSHLYLHTALKGSKLGKPCHYLIDFSGIYIYIILGFTTFQLGSPYETFTFHCYWGTRSISKYMLMKNNMYIYICTGWWFQPIWKILVKLDRFPKWGWKYENKKKSLKPPPSMYIYIHTCTLTLLPSKHPAFQKGAWASRFRANSAKRVLLCLGRMGRMDQAGANPTAMVWQSVFNFRQNARLSCFSIAE